ncbi:MAG: hypothetical protein IPP14_12240 [Planctomycetes bacterium]|nr:hypothetical protein [Planctomycetota bacterium]
MIRALGRIALCAVLCCAGGCGYTMSASLDGGPERTLRLTTIENRLFPNRPGYEYDLTRRLKDEIATDRRLKLSEGQADVVLEVALTRFVEPNLVEDLKTGRPAEVLLSARATVVARGKTVPGGEVRRTVNVSTSYAPALGEPREVGMTRLWRDMAREILDVAADTEWAAR